jgi:hypothetical protein
VTGIDLNHEFNIYEVIYRVELSYYVINTRISSQSAFYTNEVEAVIERPFSKIHFPFTFLSGRITFSERNYFNHMPSVV